MTKEKKEIRTLAAPTGAITFELERKRVKNINLRVRADGSVYVSAAPRVPLAAVEAFVAREAGFIARARKKGAARAPQNALSGAAGEAVPVFGVPRVLTFEKGAKRGVKLTETALILSVLDPADAAACRRAFLTWYRAASMEYLSALAARVSPLFAPEPPAMPALSFRTMKTRWGVCRPHKNAVTLNRRLLFADPALAEYVVYHEFCHYRHTDHSAAFWAYLARFLPDCRARRRALFAAAIPTVTERI